MNVQFIKSDSWLTCSFSGRLEAQASAEMEMPLFDAVQKAGRNVTFDMAKVEYVSSAFLRICVKSARAVKDKIKIINSNKTVLNVLKMTGLERIFDIDLL